MSKLPSGICSFCVSCVGQEEVATVPDAHSHTRNEFFDDDIVGSFSESACGHNHHKGASKHLLPVARAPWHAASNSMQKLIEKGRFNMLSRGCCNHAIAMGIGHVFQAIELERIVERAVDLIPR